MKKNSGQFVGAVESWPVEVNVVLMINAFRERCIVVFLVALSSTFVWYTHGALSFITPGIMAWQTTCVTEFFLRHGRKIHKTCWVYTRAQSDKTIASFIKARKCTFEQSSAVPDINSWRDRDANKHRLFPLLSHSCRYEQSYIKCPKWCVVYYS